MSFPKLLSLFESTKIRDRVRCCQKRVFHMVHLFRPIPCRWALVHCHSLLAILSHLKFVHGSGRQADSNNYTFSRVKCPGKELTLEFK